MRGYSDSLPFILLNKMEDAVLAIDHNFVITFLNLACEQLLDIKKEEAIGQNMYEFFPEAPDEFRHVENTLKYEIEAEIDQVPLKWGKYDKYINIRTHLLKDNKEIIGAFVQFTDVTEQAEVRKKLNKRMEEMAVSLIPLSDDVVLLPLQPTVEHYDFTYILDRSLTGLAEFKARILILDLSMIYETSPVFFEILEKLKKAVKLLGVKVVISGIKPEMAREWIHVGIHQYEITYYINLKEALKGITLER